MPLQGTDRLVRVGATAGELAALNAAHDARPSSQQAVYDEGLASMDSAGLMVVLAAVRGGSGLGITLFPRGRRK